MLVDGVMGFFVFFFKASRCKRSASWMSCHSAEYNEHADVYCSWWSSEISLTNGEQSSFLDVIATYT